MAATTRGFGNYGEAARGLIIPPQFAPASDKMRVFCFKVKADAVCIDFTWHPVEPGWLYIVPPHHRIYMPSSLWQDCVCYELKPDALPAELQLRLFSLHFALQKRVPHPAKDSYLSDRGSEPSLIQHLDEALPARIPSALKDSSIQWYRQLATAFWDAVLHRQPSQKACVGLDFAVPLCCQERTLRRACLEAFSMPPAMILRYQLTLAAMYLLAETDLKIEAISDQLEFSDASKCNRFLKNKLGLCPAAFRRLMAKNG